jgi:hypothetical protein
MSVKFVALRRAKLRTASTATLTPSSFAPDKSTFLVVDGGQYDER